MKPTLLLTFDLQPPHAAILADRLQGLADVVFLPRLEPAARGKALRDATVVLARNTAKELRPGEAAMITNARLIQYINAGVDFIPLGEFPPEVPIAANKGAYAPPIAEHAVALCLAAVKRLFAEHAALKRGEFNSDRANRVLAGGVCGILGYGGIGKAVARLLRAFGMRIYAINRRGTSDEPADWIGTPERLPDLLAAADVLTICAPLTRATRALIGARELALMKPSAILVNVARGEIVDEDALYAHLRAHPDFTACIDAWWVEPVRHGAFRLRHPFLDLPNVIGSPHNSGTVPGKMDAALHAAMANIVRVLQGHPPDHLVTGDERLPSEA